MKIYETLQDREIIKKVNEIFYEKVYEHPWLSLFFQATPKEFITQQQTDFIVGCIGGPKKFSGRLPYNAHPHMYITDELFDLRKNLLTESLKEANAPEVLITSWLRIDESFRSVIVKSSVSECEGRWTTDEILSYPNPLARKKAG